MTSFMSRYGARLIDNGYSIVPIMPGTKKPGRYSGGVWIDFVGWRAFATQPPSPYHVDTWEHWPDCGVGVLCGRVCPVDIDVLDHEVAHQVAEIIMQHLGETSVVRIGKAPKMLLVYRAEAPFSKIQMHPIECLAEGQQFVAYAIHPETGQPYAWPIDGLADTPIERLPLVSEAQVREAMQAAFAVIPDHLKPRRPLSTSAPSAEVRISSDLEGTPEGIAECMARIPNEDVSWDDWNKVGMALFAASGGRAFDLFDKFSMRSAKYDPKETLKRWNSYARSRPRSIGMGTLVHLAQEFGETPIPSDVPFNEAKREATDFDISALLETSLPPVPEPRRAATPQKQVALTAEQREAFPAEWLETTSLVGQVTRWIADSAVYPHPPLALANTLSMMGALTGRRYVLEGLNTRTNMFNVGIAETGAGKEHSRTAIGKLLVAAGLERVIGGNRFTSDTAIINMMAEYPSRLCAVDELGVYMQTVRHKNASSAQQSVMNGFLDFYSASGSIYNGKQFADTKARPRVDIHAPNFNMYASTTPESLVPALSREMVDNGLLNRMLFFPPFEMYPDFRMPARVEPPQGVIDGLREIFYALPTGAGNLASEQISTLAPQLIDVKFASGVDELLTPIMARRTELMRAGRKIWGRMGEYILKLAMIEAIARSPHEPMITEEILVMSYKLVEWCVSYMEGLFADDVSENETEARVKKVMKIIKKAGAKGITGTAIYEQTLGIQRREREDILKGLLEAGLIHEDKVKTKGRPLLVYRAA